MNKRGIILPILALSLLGLVLFALAVKEEVARESQVRNVGRLGQDLIFADQFMEETVFYYEQNFKYESLKRFVEFLGSGGVPEEKNAVWDSNPYDDLVDNFVKVLDRKLIIDDRDWPKLKGERETSIIEGEDHFFINIFYPVQITNIDNLGEGLKARIFYNRTLNYTLEVDFDLKLFDGLYKEYSRWGEDRRCKLNEDVFEGFEVTCTEGRDFLHFEVVTKGLGYVKPVIKFRIRKSGELFGK